MTEERWGAGGKLYKGDEIKEIVRKRKEAASLLEAQLEIEKASKDVPKEETVTKKQRKK